MNSGNTATVTLNAPMVIEPTSGTGTGSYTFSNNSTATPSTDANPYKMTINGSISGGATTGLITLNFTATTGNRSNDASANVMNGLISDGLSGGVSVNVTGTSGGQLGVWRFNNANNSYTGITSVSTGTLIFTSIANIGVNSSVGAGNTLNVGGGSHVKYVGGAASTDRAITGNGLFYNNGTGALTLNGTVAAGIIFRGNQSFIVNGLISGNSGISRTDGGTVFLNNNSNSFTGSLSISDGAFQAATIFNNGTNSAVGKTGNVGLGQASSTVGRFEYTGTSTSTDRLIVMQNGATNNTGRGIINVMTAGQTLTFTNGVRLNTANTISSAANYSDLTLTGVGNGEIQGQIGGTNGSPSAVVNLQIIKSGLGTWTLSGTNTYALQTTVSAGILNIRNSSALGAVLTSETVPSAANAGTVVASGATLQIQNNISVGAEALTLAGTGASGQNGALVNVSGTNSFAGALTLTANTTISSDSGSLALTNTAAIVGSGGSRALTLSGAGNGSLASSMDTGVASLTKNGSGLWTLSGSNSYTGATTVNAGTLNVTGALGNTAVTVNSGGTFSYAGGIGGNLTTANNTTINIGDVLTAGSTGTLTVGGNLVLNDSTLLLFDLGTTSDLIQANGSLITLDGIVRVTTGAGFTAGTYKLIGYTGTLTDNGLVAQALAGYDVSIVVDTVNQAVNLVATGINAQYWDGGDSVADNVVDGGDGTWTNAGTNWTLADGSNNTSWSASVEKIAVFGGVVGGTVQVQDAVAVNGLQFARNYTLANSGGQIQITDAATEMRVDTAVTATVAAPVTGAGGINKTGDGTLIFTAATGSNTYSGSTLITSGTLKIGANDTLPTGTAVTIGSGAFTGALDLSSASQQIASLQIASNNANLSSVVTIGAGQTLQVNGSMSIGIANNVKTVTRAIITGPGSLVINNTNANFDAGLQTVTSQGAADLLPNATNPFDNGANANNVTSDFTGLGSFTANVKEFRVGFGVNVNSTLLLSDTSNNITANVVQLSNSNGLNSGSSTTVLGAGSNIIATDTLNIGVSKGVATLKFASQTAGSAGTVVIGGKTGTTTDITVGSSLTTATGAQPTGTLDLRGHTATITAGALIIGKRSSGGGGGSAGTVYFDGGTFTANSVEMGTMSGNAGTSSPGPSGNGILIISGGTFTVNSGGSFVMATYANTNTFGNAKATLTISGGTLVSNVNIVEGGGAGATTANTTSIIQLTGGTLDMTGHSIGDATNTIDTLTLESGTLKDVQEINGGGAVTKSNTGTLVLLGTNTYSGATTISAGTLQAGNGGTSGTLGSGDVINNATLAFNRSDLLTVANNVSGTGVVNQTGSGTTVLSGANSYTGQTTVSAGSLLVNNVYGGADSATGTNTVQVNANATLGGTGKIAGSVNLAANATLAPGGNAATITAGTTGLSTEIGTVLIDGNLTVGASATLALQLKSSDSGLNATFDPTTNRLTGFSGTATDGSNDRIIVNGTLSLDAASAITVTLGADFTPTYQAVFDLIDWTGSNISQAYYDSGTGMRVGGSADNAGFALDLPDLTVYNSSWFWDVSLFGSTGVIAIVPEPSRALLLLGGLLGLGLRRRRLPAVR
ncbi:MAG: autotransporter-associated beta strand repeat-containing protein [Prosthecobacter sp.]|uniref:beta strand repeat-containing protein n=1 Tax=Prosthecobacter sp. TaxID=1965333 RepID=UPI0025EDF32C|nr:autotransporter-associated beta strand repeat-containing protein [Prosthecobacter sp.]MCF7786470.1 autotransporter-associated beta strand repeat-containing protein [Prosthecobacter sp.]